MEDVLALKWQQMASSGAEGLHLLEASERTRLCRMHSNRFMILLLFYYIFMLVPKLGEVFSSHSRKDDPSQGTHNLKEVRKVDIRGCVSRYCSDISYNLDSLPYKTAEIENWERISLLVWSTREIKDLQRLSLLHNKVHF